MKQGDFSELAQAYRHRTGYSLRVLKSLAAYVGAWREDFQVADIGAGTGKLTENLLELGFRIHAVEPNQAMRSEGISQVNHSHVIWSEGSAEMTGLPDNYADWILMASSFHWTDYPKTLAEFSRILKPGGYFTALWNPRNLEANELHQRIEAKIYEIAPEIQRVSSGSSRFTEDLDAKLLSTGHFTDLIFMQAPHEVQMTPERYLGAWRSVNDIQAQAGPERFKLILAAIEKEIEHLDEVIVPYQTRAWTVRSRKKCA
ncbi:SAM-dependent methyltransferase [bacterium (Candidatus Blackallbacteria) CG17_big_fil_post_rev_8_21_14_2_50_48_46]|uniref:SAM-dependent methyltransferase n=1 Tax=bacterium (Candidatus Blackallbacteria) CG17_big_fil_post_rev_8_21_14_2_50_48_46 TaxID=2014261 RepID=A0A2M7G9M2_9BACT|nr:MAG: SAM-dependent methyltransferase [bacterium (Candidatus Blackallbacteria) CG18_big_fil_WC_8_21_14_2_50_49_26]PIW18819.1 MAG: SAM-dependent methyltransferase [bacterium (Candidatus Blackallbacteria) CG17_big_fil_post_rev_8_21_14_2_50_48_46]PIW49274.1 MAG: SAM-dependent methyltransferase [bacterium (Candidatus Blackallbacteria) CG13_big_fil_rev_8_21_14_2_50_49_14]